MGVADRDDEIILMSASQSVSLNNDGFIGPLLHGFIFFWRLELLLPLPALRVYSKN